MRMTPKNLIAAANAASAGTVTSVGLDMGQIYTFSIHLIANGGGAAGTGSIVIQGSNDLVQDTNGTSSNPAGLVTNWSSISGGTLAINDATSVISSFNAQGIKWLRVRQIATGGTVTAVVNFFGQGV